MFSSNKVWQQVQKYLPEENRISDKIQPVEKVAAIQHMKIRYDEYSPEMESDTTVVIFHGVGGNGRLLSFIAVPLVRAGFNVICPDLPGYGYTKVSDTIDYSTWIDVGAFIVKREILKGRKAFAFGLSAGGMLAYNVCCRVKDISGLIITNILDNRLQIVRDYSAKNRFHSRVGIKILVHLPSCLKKIKVPVKMVANMNAIVNNKNVLSLLLKDRVGSGSLVSISFLLSMMMSVPLIEPEDFEICPVLLAHPEIDKWTPTEISRLFFDRISSTTEFTLLENAGHFPIESPGLQQLGQASINFITNCNG